MTEQIQEQDQENAVSEQSHDNSQESTEVEQQEDGQKMVPLSAMLATRKKLQEAEMRAQKAEAASQLYQEHLMRDKKEDEKEDDPNALVEKKDLLNAAMTNKRDILETLYQDMNPESVQRINKYLKPILEQKPWLAASVDSALNRWARADEIVKDYLHLVEEKPKTRTSPISDGQRIIQNSQKPRSPVEVGKSAKPEGMEYLKSIQGKKEFREYREKVLRGET